MNELIAAAMTAYQQADVLESLTTVPAVGPGGEPVLVPAPLGVVLVSQTCDIVLPGRQAVQVARRIRLTGNQAREARDRKRPRFAQLPRISDNDFADLDVIGTVAKSRVAGRPRLAGVATDEEIRRFAGDVARKFGRFAFPDEVTPWLRPLEAVAASKARKPASPEGQAFGEVVELRVEAPAGWAKRPFDLTLCVVVQPNTLPTFAGDAFPDVPDRLNDWLYDAGGELTRSSGEIAGRLLAAGSNAERHWLWMALGEAWAARCRPPVDASPSSMR
ncbi:hypothetical protein [Actinoplanes sp. RD1]|uniref:hypothetical protein n=1 Tax=Actinoplanes sp. RD1 TaxID=3064538 RepID=UPI002740684F|nr:hypothetical protein [Actinoplanes sp. RD1]